MKNHPVGAVLFFLATSILALAALITAGSTILSLFEQDDTIEWRSAWSLCSDLTTNVWSDEWKISYLSDSLRNEYITKLHVLEDLDLKSLRDGIDELRAKLSAVPRIDENGEMPGEGYRIKYREFRDAANSLVAEIENGAAVAGVRPDIHL